MGSIGDDKIKQRRRRSTCWRVTSGCVGDELEKTQVIRRGDQFLAFCSIWVGLEPTGHSAIQVADQNEGEMGVVKVSGDSGMESMENCFTLGRYGMRGSVEKVNWTSRAVKFMVKQTDIFKA